MLKRNWALIALVYLAFAEVLSLAPVPARRGNDLPTISLPIHSEENPT
jgi:hypothetical protein